VSINSSIIAFAILLCLFSNFGLLFAEENEDNSSKLLPEVLVTGKFLRTNYVVKDATTATRTETPIEEIPQSIEVINRDIIDDQRAESLQDIVHNVSGVIPGDSDIVPFLIRGFRAETLRDGFASTTFVFLNIFQEELANVERVEFLKGPASVLYGNSSSGGIINIITKKPLPYFYSSAEATIGSYDFYRGAIDISTPLNKDNSLLFRMNASYRNSDSFRDFVFSDRVFISPVLSWEISPKVLLTLEGEYLYVDKPIDEGLVAVGDMVADIPLSRNLGEPDDESTFKGYLAKASLDTELSENVFLRNAFRYYRTEADRFDHLGGALLPDNRTLLRFIADATNTSDIYTTQNDLIVNFERWSTFHTLLFGLEYIRENTSLPFKIIPASPIDIFDPVYGVDQTFNPEDVIPLSRSRKLNDIGLYIQDQITIWDKLHLLAGLRYDYLDQEIKDTASQQGDITINNSINEFSPRFGILYKLIKGISLYANYSKSFNSFLFSSFAFDGSILDPEKTEQYEGGMKFYLWEGRLSSTVAIYRITKRNALTPDPINGAVFAVQVDKERSQGFEFDLTAQPLPGWNIIGSYSFIDAEVRDDDFFDEGNKLAAVPKNSASLWTTYRILKGTLDGFGIGAGLIVVGDRKGDLQNTFKLDSYVRFDAALYYDRQIRDIGIVTASVNFKNITDEDYIATSSSRLSIIPGEPFTVFATLRVDF